MKYLQNADNVRVLMKKHADILKPKFDTVVRIFGEKLSDMENVHWTNPHGGYFVSLDVVPGTASRVCELCKNAGVVLTPAGSTFPYKNDPEDKNLRIAPSYPTVEELEKAMEVLCLCVRIAALEKA